MSPPKEPLKNRLVPLLGIFPLMQSTTSALIAKLFQFFDNFIISALQISGNAVWFIALATIPCTKLTVSVCHMFLLSLKKLEHSSEITHFVKTKTCNKKNSYIKYAPKQIKSWRTPS